MSEMFILSDNKTTFTVMMMPAHIKQRGIEAVSTAEVPG